MTRDNPTAMDVLAEDFVRRHPEDAAAEVELLPLDQLVGFFSDQSEEAAVTLLGALRPEVSAKVILHADEPSRTRWLTELPTSQTAVILGFLDDDVRDEVLTSLSRPIAREVRAIMGYPPDTAGAIMDPKVSHFRVDATVDAALNQLRSLRHMRISSLHVVDNDGIYLGSIRLQDLALADPEQRLRELMTTAPISVQAMAPRTEVVELLENFRLPTVPVVDFEGHLIGVIRHNALLSAVEAEASADMQTMVGASRDERALSPIGFAVKKRLPWLNINLLTAFLASFVVGLFEDTIASFTALAILLPVVAGQSGNTGAQALAVTMRGLALREIRVRDDSVRVALKEFCGRGDQRRRHRPRDGGRGVLLELIGRSGRGDRGGHGALHGHRRPRRCDDPHDSDHPRTGPRPGIVHRPDHRDGRRRILELSRSRDRFHQHVVTAHDGSSPFSDAHELGKRQFE